METAQPLLEALDIRLQFNSLLVNQPVGGLSIRWIRGLQLLATMR
jgi:hypothetical protein